MLNFRLFPLTSVVSRLSYGLFIRPNQTRMTSKAELLPRCLPTYTYISPCCKAHKALKFPFHPLRFAVMVLTFAHDCHPAVFLSSSTILLLLLFLSVFPRYISDFIARSVHSWSEATLFLESISCTCIGNRPASLLLFS